MSDDVELHVAHGGTTVVVEIAVHAGCRLRQVSIERDGDRVMLLTVPVAGTDVASSSGWGSFPMTPWAGRLRNGRFDVDGTTVGLALNHQDGGSVGGGPIDPPLPAPSGPIGPDDTSRHAIHGTVFARPWTIDQVDSASLDASCRLADDTDDTAGSVRALGWPFAGTARQRLRLRPDRLDLELVVSADTGVTFPAAVGWHPWFAKPDRLEFDPTAMYALDDIALPTGETVPPTDGPWDDCFLANGPIRLIHDRTLAPVITVTSDCDHWVLYDKPHDATCVEPQSGPPDAPNIAPHMVTPDRPLRRTMTIAW